MAGYNGYSKSNNAVDAENEGRYPLTRASQVVAKATGVVVKEARRVLDELGTSEFHHSSKFYNPVKYYETKRAIDMILHGDPDYTENIESEKFKTEHELIEIKRASCSHEYTGKSYNWYCPKCQKKEYSYKIPF